MIQKVLIISVRNFGDAAITTRLVNRIKHKFEQVDILTRKSFIPIFQSVSGVSNIHIANFPVGTQKNFGLKELYALVKLISKLRANQYDLVLNNIGDFRENLLGWLVKGRRNISVKWHAEHPFNQLIRSGFNCLLTDYIDIPGDVINIYQIQDLIAHYITGESDGVSHSEYFTSRGRVGIHTGASQKSKFWHYHNWEYLIDFLYNKFQNRVIVFCSKDEIDELTLIFSKIEDKIEFSCGSVDEFLNRLREDVDLFIGLDSFAVHAAEMQNVSYIIMLNGANDARVWKPLNGEIVQKEHSCPYFPCYNKPKCIGSPLEFACMKQITPSMVIKKIEDILSDKHKA